MATFPPRFRRELHRRCARGLRIDASTHCGWFIDRCIELDETESCPAVVMELSVDSVAWRAHPNRPDSTMLHVAMTILTHARTVVGPLQVDPSAFRLASGEFYVPAEAVTAPVPPGYCAGGIVVPPSGTASCVLVFDADPALFGARLQLLQAEAFSGLWAGTAYFPFPPLGMAAFAASEGGRSCDP